MLWLKRAGATSSCLASLAKLASHATLHGVYGAGLASSTCVRRGIYEVSVAHRTGGWRDVLGMAQTGKELRDDTDRDSHSSSLSY